MRSLYPHFTYFAVATILMASCSVDGSRESPDGPVLDVPKSVTPVAEDGAIWAWAKINWLDGNIAEVVLEESNEILRIDLTFMEVFDCRVDCFLNANDGHFADIAERLQPLGNDTKLCIHSLYLREGSEGGPQGEPVQRGKIAIERYTCERGGRAIP